MSLRGKEAVDGESERRSAAERAVTTTHTTHADRPTDRRREGVRESKRERERSPGFSSAHTAMANIAVQRIKREFKEVLKSEEVR